MCAALENLINEGDHVLSLVLGNFGNRWAKIAESRGAIVEKIEVSAGEVISPEVLKKRLDEDKNKENNSKYTYIYDDLYTSTCKCICGRY